MTTPDMHTLTGAYALDALSDIERAQFRRHLEQCEACSQEVHELQATASRLGAAMAEEPPPEMKDRVLAAMRTTRQLPPDVVAGPQEVPRARRRWALGLAAAAAVVGLALAGVFGGVALHTQGQLNTAQERVDQARAQYQPVSELLAAPDVRTAHAGATDGGGGTVLVSRQLDRVMFMEDRLPPSPAGKVYQAWLMGPGVDPRPVGLLPGGPDGSLVVADGIGRADQVGVSVEPAGGSPSGKPSADVVLVAPMPA
ncbi:anti-sigma factor [Amycolatopsis sp. PS_44_ISF1]|uniref:anti-sigma factor n=1 Tax=Amycolatopsis sp. PS_44_ISF1 TaxID=2974917 RepID=UPI0028E01B68|nr:anti-sigma factor [Amycolatopsis sp. PS_44_ISF1]MDT8914875.1 anti-sigma factor [Amycolatopsis sp. PS_44_ISF1]